MTAISLAMETASERLLMIALNMLIVDRPVPHACITIILVAFAGLLLPLVNRSNVNICLAIRRETHLSLCECMRERETASIAAVDHDHDRTRLPKPR